MWRPSYFIRRPVFISTPYILQYLFLVINVSGVTAGDLWPLDRPEGMPSIQSLEVMCGKDHMDVHLTFSQPFEGIVSSKGQHGDPRCVYVPPSTRDTFFSFRIAYARCGTKPDLHGQFYENTVVVQYDKDLLEVWDEAKRLRCEWFNDYEKTASKPPMVIADLDVIQLDFRGDNVDCWMEIQHGKGPWAPPVSGIVSLGSTLTLVVAINDYRGEFDMRVKSCVASDGAGHVIQLSDEFGCVLRPKMISRFLKARGADERASVITYAFFHAFKFPDALSVHIKCKVEICRHGCLDHCQLQPEGAEEVNPELTEPYVNPLERKDVKGAESSEDYHSSDLPYYNNALERKDELDTEDEDSEDSHDSGLYINPYDSKEVSSSEKEDTKRMPDPPERDEDDLLYEDIISENNQDPQSPVKMSLSANVNDRKVPQIKKNEIRPLTDELDPDLGYPHKDIYPMPIREKFPHGPRTFEEPIVGAPRSLDDVSYASVEEDSAGNDSVSEKVTKQTPVRRKRNVIVSDRKARSTDVGVSGLYEVISEADLAFSPDSRAEAVAVFQGRIREEVVYGICMPVPGFSLLFVLVAVSAVVSALVAGSLLYRYQLQKEQLAEQAHHQNGSIPMNPISTWMSLRILRIRNNVRNAEQNGKNVRPESNGKLSRETHVCD